MVKTKDIQKYLGINYSTALEVNKVWKEYTTKINNTWSHNKKMILGEDAMRIMDKIIDGYGVEYITSRKGKDLFYINKGDTYDPTILFEPHKSRVPFSLWDWGSWVEREDY